MPTKTKQPTKNELLFLLFAVLFCGGIMLWGSMKPGGKAPEVDRDPNKVDKVIACKEAIREQAKIPKEADFEWDYRYSFDGEKSIIIGNVELMNAFGTMIPKKYGCELMGSLVTKAFIGD